MATQPTDMQPDKGWTAADYMEMEDDEQRYELLRGRLTMTPSPTFRHQSVLSELGWHLMSHVKENELGICVQAPCDVVLSDENVVQPDFLYLAADRVDELLDGDTLAGPPDLVVEVLSPSTAARDRTDKRAIYAESGVPWMVLVDPSEQTVEVYELGEDGRYVLDGSASEDDVLVVGLFADLEIPLEQVWGSD